MIKAIIFDMDGVISDTEKVHAAVETGILGKFGIKMSEDEFSDKYAGIPSNVFIRELLGSHGVNANVEKIIENKWKKVIKIVGKRVSPMPGALELIKVLKKEKYKLAVGSSSIPEFVELILKKLEIRGYFNAVITIKDVKNGKPDPEIFLLAAKKLGVKPENCVVIEDGRSGMLAAKRAGMRCVGLVKDKSRKDYPADILVESLNKVDITIFG